jgi:hypothetical protein
LCGPIRQRLWGTGKQFGQIAALKAMGGFYFDYRTASETDQPDRAADREFPSCSATDLNHTRNRQQEHENPP